jgi:hypothetical protein
MSFEYGRAQIRKPLGHSGTLEVRTGDFIAEVQQYLGDAAHADAADSDEMNVLDFREHDSSPLIYAD